MTEPKRWWSNHPGPTRDMKEVVEASAYDALKRQLEEYEHETETVKELKAENERLRAVLKQLTRFSIELCEDIKVSTNQYSINMAREALGLDESER
jgi:chromatin segregation and condensation protein Rec8/ScpA/Scc1 (kleisin family)